MSPVTPSAPRQVGKPQPAPPGGYAGQILRVDLAKRKAWADYRAQLTQWEMDRYLKAL